MHLFLRERGLAPAEIADGFGTVRERFPRPQTRHAGQGIGVKRRPVYWTRLLFHDPPTAFSHGAVKVVVEGLQIGVALAGEAAFVVLGDFQAV